MSLKEKHRIAVFDTDSDEIVVTGPLTTIKGSKRFEIVLLPPGHRMSDPQTIDLYTVRHDGETVAIETDEASALAFANGFRPSTGEVTIHKHQAVLDAGTPVEAIEVEAVEA